MIPALLQEVSPMEIKAGMVGKAGKRVEQLHRLDPHGKASRAGCSPSQQPGFCRDLHVINSLKRAGTGSKTATKTSGFTQQVQTGDPTSCFSIFSGRLIYLPSFHLFSGPTFHPPRPSFSFCFSDLSSTPRLKWREHQSGL